MQLVQNRPGMDLSQSQPVFGRQRPRLFLHPIQLCNQQQGWTHTGSIRVERLVKVASQITAIVSQEPLRPGTLPSRCVVIERHWMILVAVIRPDAARTSKRPASGQEPSR